MRRCVVWSARSVRTVCISYTFCENVTVHVYPPSWSDWDREHVTEPVEDKAFNASCISVAVAAAASSALSFMVFWLILGEPIKAHSCGPGCTYYLAPVWLVMAIAGMGAMVLAPRLTMPCDRSRQHARVTSAGAAG